jgi:hypothetical protein
MGLDRYNLFREEGPAEIQLQRIGQSSRQIIEEFSLTDLFNTHFFEGREVITNLTSGATVASDAIRDGVQLANGTATIFDDTPLVAPVIGAGACCTFGGDTADTPVCFRNTTNPFAFYREELSRCDTLLALEANAQSSGQSETGAFSAGDMDPLTFQAFDCQCRVIVDDAVTVTAILALLGRPDLTTANAIIAQVLADVGNMVPDPMAGVSGISTARMPAENFQITNLGGTRWRMTVEINAAANPADNTASPVMFGEMAIQMNDGMGFQEQFPNAVLVDEFVESFSCINCPPLPQDFVQPQAEAGAQAAPATLLGLPVAAGGAVIGVICFVGLLIIGGGVGFYVKKRNQMNVFTSGQESV